jgi:hypothetical protein
MLHKQIVFAAIAVTALMGLIVPLTAFPAANAQVDAGAIAQGALDAVFGGDDAAEGDGGDGVDQSGDDNQNLEQTNEQNQEAEQEVEQEVSQDEENEQSNELNTGDNTATVTQANAAEQAVEAAAAAESGDAEAEAEDESKHKKDHHYSSSTTADAESIATATAEATGIIDQDNAAAIEQDSSANDNVLANVNEFGDDEATQVAVPIIDQDQTAENRAVNLDLDLDDEYGQVVDGGAGGGGGGQVDLNCELLSGQPFIAACLALEAELNA